MYLWLLKMNTGTWSSLCVLDATCCPDFVFPKKIIIDTFKGPAKNTSKSLFEVYVMYWSISEALGFK